ncbi:MAG: CcmD family protein [Ferruginibacter sp.]
MVKKIVSHCSFLVVAFLISMSSFAQDKSVEMADTMRSNGKIYIVVAVCLTILIGLFLYMMRIDMKMSKIEKNKHAEA